jgi:integral membrane protein
MNALSHLRIASMLEGISYLFLLFVAMPMKYVAGAPEWVKWAGRVHGGLFVLLVLVLARCALSRSWNLSRSLRVMGFALVPFGAFVLDREFARELGGGEAVTPEPS